MQCVSCHDPIGIETGELPFTAHDGETWCPQCFGHKRACLEPERYYPGGFNAVRCLRCKLLTVAIGPLACTQCGSENVLCMPPKPEIVLGDTGGMKKIVMPDALYTVSERK